MREEGENVANICDYEMKVKGSAVSVEKFFDAMRWRGEYVSSGVGRVFYAEVIETEAVPEGTLCYIVGECAWSVLSAMRKAENRLEVISKNLGLKIEVYSSECGCRFMEHFAVDKGEILCDDCFDWVQIYEEDIDDDFWESQEAKDNGITKENYKNYIDADGYLSVGGVVRTWDYI